MKVTKVDIKKVNNTKNEKLKAFVDIVIEDAVVIHGIRLFKDENDKYSIAMPAKKKEEHYLDIVHPINAETRKLFEDAIIESYKASIKE